MAATLLSRSCPIRSLSVHLLDAAGQLLRVIFLDREVHLSAQPHYILFHDNQVEESRRSG
jgi:hypothetical protein